MEEDSDSHTQYHKFELLARIFARSAEISRQASAPDGPVDILAAALTDVISDQQELIQVWALMQLTTVAAQRVALQQRASQAEQPVPDGADSE